MNASAPVTVIEPRGRWRFLDLAEVWRFRGLLFRFAARDVTLRYRQTALGVIWVVAQPLIAAGVFGLVFGRVAHLPSNGLPYFLFTFAGMMAWLAFNGVLSKANGSLIGNSALVSKIYFPRVILPLSVVGSTLIDFAVSLVMLVILLVVYGVNPGVQVLLLPVWLLVTVMLGLGVGLATSSLSVRYRDVAYVIPIAVQFLLYASPVAYALDAVPHSVRPFFVVNPLTGVLEAFRWSALGAGSLPAAEVAYSAGAAVVLLLLGAFVFSSTERRFADVI